MKKIYVLNLVDSNSVEVIGCKERSSSLKFIRLTNYFNLYNKNTIQYIVLNSIPI